MKAKAKNITSIRQLARLLGRDQKTVRAWIADDRWEFARKAPWKPSDVEKIDAWRIRALDQQPDVDTTGALVGLSPERRAKIELVIERTAKVRLERELLAGKLLKRDDVEADLLARANEAKQALISITGLAGRLAGKTESEITTLLSEHVGMVCNTLAGGSR